MVAGNYHKQTGFGFGGFEWSTSVRNLRTLTLNILNIPAAASEVVLIDVHVSIPYPSVIWLTYHSITHPNTPNHSFLRVEDGAGTFWCGHVAVGLPCGGFDAGRAGRGGLPHRGRRFRGQGRLEEQWDTGIVTALGPLLVRATHEHHLVILHFLLVCMFLCTVRMRARWQRVTSSTSDPPLTSARAS